jgi:hypothetical protein
MGALSVVICAMLSHFFLKERLSVRKSFVNWPYLIFYPVVRLDRLLSVYNGLSDHWLVILSFDK